MWAIIGGIAAAATGLYYILKGDDADGRKPAPKQELELKRTGQKIIAPKTPVLKDVKPTTPPKVPTEQNVPWKKLPTDLSEYAGIGKPAPPTAQVIPGLDLIVDLNKDELKDLLLGSETPALDADGNPFIGPDGRPMMGPAMRTVPAAWIKDGLIGGNPVGVWWINADGKAVVSWNGGTTAYSGVNIPSIADNTLVYGRLGRNNITDQVRRIMDGLEPSPFDIAKKTMTKEENDAAQESANKIYWDNLIEWRDWATKYPAALADKIAPLIAKGYTRESLRPLAAFQAATSANPNELEVLYWIRYSGVDIPVGGTQASTGIQRAKVSATLKMRSAPSINASQVGTADKGMLVDILQLNAAIADGYTWARIKNNISGVEGFAAQKYLIV